MIDEEARPEVLESRRNDRRDAEATLGIRTNGNVAVESILGQRGDTSPVNSPRRENAGDNVAAQDELRCIGAILNTRI